MFRLVYRPEGAAPQEFEFDPDNPLNLDAEALESLGGDAWVDYAGWLERIGYGNIRARRALLWLMLRRSNPEVRFVDVVFRVQEFQILQEDEPEPVGKDSGDDSPTDSTSPTPDSDPSPSN